MNAWIKTDDTLPENNKPVMITDGKTQAIAMNTEFGCWVPYGVEGYPRGSKLMLDIDPDDITHWAKLLELPKAED